MGLIPRTYIYHLVLTQRGLKQSLGLSYIQLCDLSVFLIIQVVWGQGVLFKVSCYPTFYPFSCERVPVMFSPNILQNYWEVQIMRTKVPRTFKYSADARFLLLLKKKKKSCTGSLKVMCHLTPLKWSLQNSLLVSRQATAHSDGAILAQDTFGMFLGNCLHSWLINQGRKLVFEPHRQPSISFWEPKKERKNGASELARLSYS